jgi:hypothetical protein
VTAIPPANEPPGTEPRVSLVDEPSDVVLRDGVYGDRVVAVEPGGAEFIPLAERHGRPRQLFWTWCSPNLEFATIFVGVLAVSAFSLGFWGACSPRGVPPPACL